jgi:hypothetical protein
LANSWEGLPVTNSWEDVLDEGISIGHTNWQLFGSCKPNHEAYKLTQVYNITYDTDDQSFRIDNIDLQKFNIDKTIIYYNSDILA